MELLNDWSNFRKALNAYSKDRGKFIKCPKPPNYKNKLAQVIYFSQTIKNGRSKKPLTQLTANNNCFSLPNRHQKYKQILITPKTFGFIIDVQYEEEKQPKLKKLNKNKICTIDVGVNNLAAITLDQQRSILVNGRIVKSFNQWYNKNQCKKRLRKRYFRIENYFHHVSKMIIELCVANDTGKIIIGKNDGWKQDIKMRSVNKQNFQYIPFINLFEKIKYKAEEVGIEVIFTEEAYTSKASFYDRDPLPEYNEDVEPQFSGKRKHRGLYIASDGFALNADVNGSLNIGRKVIPEFLGIGDRSLAARPRIINPLRKQVGEGLVVDNLN